VRALQIGACPNRSLSHDETPAVDGVSSAGERTFLERPRRREKRPWKRRWCQENHCPTLWARGSNMLEAAAANRLVFSARWNFAGGGGDP
jgi:hypothetical protein